MKIACIGWGSLIWKPESLKVQNRWFEDGPILPIEFARHSEDDRITLIIDPDKATKPVRTLWTLMTVAVLEDAQSSLMEREKTKHRNISSVSRSVAEEKDPIRTIIREWLDSKDLDAAIWTALSYSKVTNSEKPPIDYVLKHLRNLADEKKKVAEEYIRKAPRQIDTVYRRKIEAEFGWSHIE